MNGQTGGIGNEGNDLEPKCVEGAFDGRESQSDWRTSSRDSGDDASLAGDDGQQSLEVLHKL